MANKVKLTIKLDYAETIDYEGEDLKMAASLIGLAQNAESEEQSNEK